MDGVEIQCRIQCDDLRLTVTYSVENHSGVEIGLFNRVGLVEVDGSTTFGPDNVYVDFAGETLILWKAPPTIPKGLFATATSAPAVTLVQGGKRFEETLSLRVPVSVHEPMRRALLANKAKGALVIADRLVNARALEVTVGAFHSAPDLEYRPLYTSVLGPLAVWPPGVAVARMQLLTCTEALFEPLPVLDYRVVPTH